MADHRNDNKRIAKNTLIIYINLFLNLLIGVVSSRFVLQALGVSDFGLYNVAGGVVFMFLFISNALSSTTTRFVNVEMGKPGGDIQRIFNICRILHIAMAVLMILLLEVGGVYYMNHFLNVDPGKEQDAMFVFQVAVVTWCIGIINVPYSSLFNATEKFLFSAIIEMVGKLIQFGLVIWLLGYDGNRLRAYSLIMLSYTLVPFLAFRYFIYRFWPGFVQWKFVNGWQHYKEVISFSSYNLLSGLASMSRSQGCVLLINYFFGTTVNGSYAVARTVEGHVNAFSNKFQDAAGPQITQNYSGGNHERVYYLTSRIGKYTMLLSLLAFFPLWAEMGFVLDVWLAEVPERAMTFCRLTLLMVLVSVTDGGIGKVVNASGKVSRFRTVYSVLMLVSLPIGFFILKAGASPYYLLALFIAADVVWRVSQLWMAHRILQFPVIRFCRDAYLPVAMVSVIMVLCVFLTSLLPWDSILWHLGRFLLILFLTATAAYFLGLKKGERQIILHSILKKLKRSKNDD